MEVSWLSTVLIMLEDIPHCCPVVRDLVMDVSIGQVLKGLPYLHLTLWLLRDICCTDNGSLPQPVMQWLGQFKCLQQRFISSVGKKGHVDVLERVYQTMPYLLLKLVDFLVCLFRLGLAQCTIGIYHSAILAFLQPHYHHKASNHSIISELIHHFYLQHPPSHKCFDLLDVECLLLLLESLAPASSLTNFKLAWKTATLLGLVAAKHFSNLSLLCIDN